MACSTSAKTLFVRSRRPTIRLPPVEPGGDTMPVYNCAHQLASMTSPRTVDIVVPVFNEGDALHGFHARLTEATSGLPHAFRFLYVTTARATIRRQCWPSCPLRIPGSAPSTS